MTAVQTIDIRLRFAMTNNHSRIMPSVTTGISDTSLVVNVSQYRFRQ